jgi:hypothetical protein
MWGHLFGIPYQQITNRSSSVTAPDRGLLNIDLGLSGPLQGFALRQKCLCECRKAASLNPGLKLAIPLPNRCHRLSLVVNEGQLKDKLVLDYSKSLIRRVDLTPVFSATGR